VYNDVLLTSMSSSIMLDPIDQVETSIPTETVIAI
jgi:hypothetical protein